LQRLYRGVELLALFTNSESPFMLPMATPSIDASKKIMLDEAGFWSARYSQNFIMQVFTIRGSPYVV
jgi:hypothetical protein